MSGAMGFGRAFVLGVAVAVLASACAPVAPGGAGVGSPQDTRPTARKRIVAAFIKPDIVAVSALPNESEGRHFAQVVHAGLAQEDDGGRLHPQLAEAVPTLENGLWKIAPDGSMETTWKIRPDARWHDGAPVQAADAVFGTRVQQDRELGFRIPPAYAAVRTIDTPDASTVVVHWKEPYIEADTFFASPERLLPRHVLEEPYVGDKARFMEHPYFTDEFVGAGPYRVKEYARGSYLLLEAFEGYPLGRPRADEVEIRFISDTSAMIANLLAGAVHMTLGLSVAPDQAAQVRDQWREGRVVTSPYTSSSVATFPQMLDPALPIVKDVQFRRALLHAIDRQEMVDTIMLAQGGIAHTFVPSLWREYEDLQSALVKHEFDTRRSAQLLEGLGYRKGTSGFYEDVAGHRLAFEHWGIQEEQERVRATLSVTDYWQRLGLDVQPFIVPAQRGRDAEYTSQFPAFMVRGVPGDLPTLRTFFHSSQVPTAENRFTGNNRARYANPELDRLIDRYFATIPLRERTQALREAVRIQSEQATWMGLFYAVYNTMISNGLKDVTPASNRAKAFNAHLWQLT